MDYKYIEQLLERYWLCETSLEEERILRAFFCQENVPDGLRKYKSLFALEKESMQQHSLGDDFDKRMLELVGHSEPQRVKAVRISLQQRMMPLFKAAAVVAMVLTIGDAAQLSMGYRPQESAAPQMLAADTAKIDNGMVTAGVDQTVTDSIAVKSIKTMSDSIKPEIAVEHNIR